MQQEEAPESLLRIIIFIKHPRAAAANVLYRDEEEATRTIMGTVLFDTFLMRDYCN